ncbi:MAG: hypothetical protein SGI83_01490 [Bacteroidota bacterium]|nr:hypothetical protein [Bacteroidota bacterium]
MKKNLLTVFVLALCLSFTACGGGGKKSAASIAKEWCDLNGKVYKAAEGAEKDAAKAAMDKWENEMEAKYKGDEAFMKEVEKETEKCEAASEGK